MSGDSGPANRAACAGTDLSRRPEIASLARRRWDSRDSDPAPHLLLRAPAWDPATIARPAPGSASSGHLRRVERRPRPAAPAVPAGPAAASPWLRPDTARG